MKSGSLPLPRLVAVLFAGAGIAAAQLSSTISLSNGVEIQVTTNLGQPTGEEQISVEMVRASGDSFYRILWDQNHLAVFAYELVVSRSADGNEMFFVAKPAEDEFAARFPNADAGKPVPSLSSDHTFEPLRSGQSSQLGLFEIPGMGLAVSDSVHVVINQEAAGSGSGPIRFANLQVSINGGAVAQAMGSVSGRYAMFYLPGRGGYIFSAGPPDRGTFAKVGTIAGNKMQFIVDNDTFNCTSSLPILAHDANSDVWVYHDTAYQPLGNWTQPLGTAAQPDKLVFFTAASDSLDWWLR